jgi:uncharacterized protein (TIGR03437 family)
VIHSRLHLYISALAKFPARLAGPFPVRLAAAAFALLLFAFSTYAQQSRITQPVNNQQRVTLTGHIHPKARAANDQGRVSPGLELSTVMLNLSPSAAQKTALTQLLKDQQTAGSANYHRWLTPEQYAERFGASDADIAKITTWLESQGLSIASVGRGHSSISVNGTAAQVEAAFQIELHQYSVNGELHFANSTEPSVPAAFAGIVSTIRGLHDFRMKPRQRAPVRPDYNSASLCGGHCIAPGDLAVIYDINPLYAAGFDGTGQKLVIAGQTVINLADINTFRNSYGLSANPPQTLLVPGTRSPGVSEDDLPEADLDVEWSGSVARGATIIFVYTEDVMNSVQYAIDQDLAPVVSVSYGDCELETDSADLATYQAWALQANAQGITWFAASGDDGGADCGDSENPGLSVDAPGSVPEVTSVGGTQLNEGAGNYWSATQSASGTSALSYIPEVVWNTSVEDGEPSASGGGASVYFTKPSWQVGNGVPNDNARHVPDVALAASPDHDGYLVYTGGQLQVFGGTSVPTPSFAGIATLINQYLVSSGGAAGLGNINVNLYALAQTNYAGIFHDITVGNNIVTVPCQTTGRRPTACGNLPVGYTATPYYDQTTGLGSVDVNNLVLGWTGNATAPPPVTPPPTSATPTITLLSNITTLFGNSTAYLTATLVSPNAITPAGSVSFEDNGVILGSATLAGEAGSARATLAITGSQLPAGSSTIEADFPGTSATINVTLTSPGSDVATPPTISQLTDAAQYQQAFSPGGIMSIFGSQLSTSAPQSAAGVPLPISMSGVAVLVNGVPAPLYYSSPTQLNVQIPYETTTGVATVSVNNNGKVASQSINVNATGPAIFTDANNYLVPTNTAARGQEIGFYITGAGAVTPALFTGSAPAAATLAELPMPIQTPVVTVGGVPAVIDFVGIPNGLVGVIQINIQVPTNISVNTQSVVVSVGGRSSGNVFLTITN